MNRKCTLGVACRHAYGIMLVALSSAQRRTRVLVHGTQHLPLNYTSEFPKHLTTAFQPRLMKPFLPGKPSILGPLFQLVVLGILLQLVRSAPATQKEQPGRALVDDGTYLRLWP